MRNHNFRDEAEACRREAAQFAGRPEANFLLRLARSFDELECAAMAHVEGAKCQGLAEQ